jgi:hypothetical protein
MTMVAMNRSALDSMLISIHLVHATTATMVAMKKNSTHVYDIRQEDFLVGMISDNAIPSA